MAQFVLFILVLKTGLCYSFLLSNTSSNGLTVNEFQYLSQLIFNGDQSRHHVENELTSLEQRVARLEQDLRTKYEQDLRNKETEYEQKLHNVTILMEQRLNTTKRDLEQELNETKTALVKQTRTTEHLKYSFDKETSNRHQIQQEYAQLRLKLEFHNLSHAHDLSTIATKAEVASLSSNVLELMTNLSSYQAAVSRIQQKIGYQSAFSVTGTPTAGPFMRYTISSAVTSNFGGHYNVTSGIFTCVYPGTYVFILNIYKSGTSAHQAYCWIWKNGYTTGIIAESYPGASFSGYLHSSNSVVLHLDQGDTISLGACSDPGTFHNICTFSGFLLQAD